MLKGVGFDIPHKQSYVERLLATALINMRWRNPDE